MSRVGKLPIKIPDAVNLDFSGNIIKAKGPKGELSVNVHPDMKIKLDNGILTIERPSESKEHRSLHGLNRALVANIIQGVNEGFEKRLEIVGVGYRAELREKNLFLSLGFSHQIIFVPPAVIDISLEGNNVIIVRGIEKELVGQVAAKIRSFRPPEPYKGKGIRYLGEAVRKKAGKTAG